MDGGVVLLPHQGMQAEPVGPVLELRDVAHCYRGGVQALSGVTLEIQRGMFGLLGPNGAGKSTLMRTVATLQQPTSGQVLYNGIDVVREPNRIRSVLGYLPQEFGVYPGVSAEDLLDHLAVLKNIGPAKVRREQTFRKLAKGFLEKVFDGAMDEYVMHALESRRMSPVEIERLERMIAAAKEQAQNRPAGSSGSPTRDAGARRGRKSGGQS